MFPVAVILLLLDRKSLITNDRWFTSCVLHTTNCAETFSPFQAVSFMLFCIREIGAGSSFLYRESVLPQLTCVVLTFAHCAGLVATGFANSLYVSFFWALSVMTDNNKTPDKMTFFIFVLFLLAIKGELKVYF